MTTRSRWARMVWKAVPVLPRNEASVLRPLAPGPPSRYTAGMGAGVDDVLFTIATASRTVAPPVTPRFSGTVTVPQVTRAFAGTVKGHAPDTKPAGAGPSLGTALSAGAASAGALSAGAASTPLPPLAAPPLPTIAPPAPGALPPLPPL